MADLLPEPPVEHGPTVVVLDLRRAEPRGERADDDLRALRGIQGRRHDRLLR